MRLLSLGTAQLVPTSGAASATLAVGTPYALLLYLSAAPNRSATRSALISLLWADLEPDAAKHALRQTIWYLKKKSGRELVRVDGDTLSLGDEVQVDRDALLEASKRGDHARLVELYAGAFVSSFAAPGGGGIRRVGIAGAPPAARALPSFRWRVACATPT